MVAASLLLYLGGRNQLTVVLIVSSALLVMLGLLALGVTLDVGTVDSSPVDGRFLAPFRWGAWDQPTFA